MNVLRSAARKLHLGSGLLKLRHHVYLGVKGSIELRNARRSILPAIVRAPAASASDNVAEIHMLLGHVRVFEALWALLSLDRFSERSLSVVVHDDGSLTADDGKLLRSKLPKLRIITKEEADRVVKAEFERRQLHNCLRFRNRFIMARKLFDPALFATSAFYVALDSDVIFFDNAADLLGTIDGAEATTSRYSL